MRYLILFLLIFTSLGCANPTVENDQRQELFNSMLPKSVCRSDLTFVSCLQISKQECLWEAEYFASQCNQKIPKAYYSSHDSYAQRGLALGLCIEESLLNKYTKQNLKTPECEKSQGLKRIQDFRKSGNEYAW